MSEIAEPRQLSLFSKSLPYKPYCSDDPQTYGLKILPAQAALEKRFIQYNPPAMIHWLAFDIDRPHLGFDADWGTLAPPNIIVINPENRHSHYLYGIAAGVSTTSASRDGPRRLLSAINEGYRHALDADPGFTQLICKNPLHEHWMVELLRHDLYDLNELAEYVDLNAADERIRKTPKKHRYGIGRNCALFDTLRTWAYKWVGEYRGGRRGLEAWHTVVLDRAEKLNTFKEPLGFNEVKAIARSVAKWTYNHYDGKLTESSLVDAGMTPEVFSMVQSNLGKLGNAKRWGDNSTKKEEAKILRAQGLRQVEIAEQLGVTQKTVSKWLAGNIPRLSDSSPGG